MFDRSKCVSDYYPKHFHQLPQICHSIQSLSITFNNYNNISNGLKELISSQNHLKSLGLNINTYGNYWKDIIPVLAKHHNTLTRLHLYKFDIKLSFSISFINLQELVISNLYIHDESQHTIFPNLQIFKLLRISHFSNNCLNSEMFK